MSQKQAIFESIKSVYRTDKENTLCYHESSFLQAGEMYAYKEPVKLSNEEINKIVKKLVRLFENGKLKTLSKVPIKKYAKNILKDALRRDERLNGGNRYISENPGIRRKNKKYEAVKNKDLLALFKLILDRNDLVRQYKGIKNKLSKRRLKLRRIYTVTYNSQVECFKHLNDAKKKYKEYKADERYEIKGAVTNSYYKSKPDECFTAFDSLYKRDVKVSFNTVNLNVPHKEVEADEVIVALQVDIDKARKKLDNFTKKNHYKRRALTAKLGTCLDSDAGNKINGVFIGAIPSDINDEYEHPRGKYFSLKDIREFIVEHMLLK